MLIMIDNANLMNEYFGSVCVEIEANSLVLYKCMLLVSNRRIYLLDDNLYPLQLSDNTLIT